MSSQRCKHDFLVDQCAECRPAPPGVTARVYVTSAGQVFHRTSTCTALLDGQAMARHFGHEPRDARQVPVNDARGRGLSPCMVCFAAAYRS